MARKYGPKAEKKIGKVMREFKEGKLHSGSKTGPKVKSRKQAIAIGISEAKRAGAKVPKRKPTATRAKRKTTRKSS
ncbi:MAG: DUF6496 domain-containing protein [Archangium sp.]